MEWRLDRSCIWWQGTRIRSGISPAARSSPGMRCCVPTSGTGNFITGCARRRPEGITGAPGRAATAEPGGSRSVQFASCFEYLGNMAGHLHLAPLTAQHTFTIDQEGAALDPFVFLAVELLLADHVEQPAEAFIRVADQLEGETLLGAEVLVGAQEIGRA